MNNKLGQGALIAVVGASGVGKDTVLNGAKPILETNENFHFAKRYITRPNDAGGEDHISVSAIELKRLEDDGKLCASWLAHGLHYGLPVSIEAKLNDGRNVVVNFSRNALANIANRFPQTAIVEITATPEIIARRLMFRGRETPTQIENRKNRVIDHDWSQGLQVTEIENNGPPSQAIEAFIGCVISIAARTAEPA